MRISALHEVQDARRACLFKDETLLSELKQMEFSPSLFTLNAEDALKYSLLRTSAETKSRDVFDKVLKPQRAINTNHQSLLQTRNCLRELSDALNTSSLKLARERFAQLSSKDRSTLRWAVWLNDYIAGKNPDLMRSPHYGADQVNADISVLKKPAECVIHLCGGGLVDQLLRNVEDQLSLERQRDIVSIINAVSKLLKDDTSDQFIIGLTIMNCLESLPMQLQWQWHSDVQKAMDADHLGFEWGKKKLYANPFVLIQCRHPLSEGESLLQYYLRTQTDIFERCGEALDVTAFEHMQALLPKLKVEAQKQELRNKLSARVRRWVDACTISEAEKKLIVSKNEYAKFYETRGAHYHDKATTFRVFAPHAKNISVILTVFGRDQHRLPMHKNSAGMWECTTGYAQPGQTYLYHVEDCHGNHMLRNDPVSFSTAFEQERFQVQSQVTDLAAYEWNDAEWMAERAKTDPLRIPLSIYQVHLKSWLTGASNPLNFRKIAPELAAYCKKMGFTHVEALDLLEPGQEGKMGYHQTAHFFAPYHGSGNSDDLKYLIDQLHQSGIGFILNWNCGHFYHRHQTAHYSVSMHEFDGIDLLSSFEESSWGTLYLDYNKEEARRLMFASALYFLEKLHVDGILIDEVGQVVSCEQGDIPAGISFVRELNDLIHTCYPGVLTIAGESDGFVGVTLPTQEEGLGFGLQWNTKWSREARKFMQTTGEDRAKHWQNKLIDYLNVTSLKKNTICTHSYVDSGERSLLQCVATVKKVEERFAILRTFFCLQAFSQARHLISAGDELGQNLPWHQRYVENLSSVDWTVLETDPMHHKLQECVSAINKLYLSKPQFWRDSIRNFQMISQGDQGEVIAYCLETLENKSIVVIHNFSRVSDPLFIFSELANKTRRVKRVTEIFNSDDPQYGGSGEFANHTIEIRRTLADDGTLLQKLKLPPYATLVLEEELV